MKFLFFIIMLALGSLVGWLVYTKMQKHTFGELWGAVITGVIGAFIGHFLFNKIIDKIMRELLNFDVNVLAALTGSFLLVWLLTKVSPGSHKNQKR